VTTNWYSRFTLAASEKRSSTQWACIVAAKRFTMSVDHLKVSE